MNVLIVSRDGTHFDSLKKTLNQSGYAVQHTDNGQTALNKLQSEPFQFVVADWHLPTKNEPTNNVSETDANETGHINGFQLHEQLRQHPNTQSIYFIMVTSGGDEESQQIARCLNAGVNDFIPSRFQPMELVMRLQAGQRIRSLESQQLLIFSLAKLAEARDPETGAHLERLRAYCHLLAEDYRDHQKDSHPIDDDYIESLYLTSPLHDIGKMGIPDHILLKPGQLTEDEFEIMKTHTLIGAETLNTVLQHNPEITFLKMAHDIALTHHERYDGSGYPHGLIGEQIPLCGRIVALADVYDALTTKRVYKEAFTHDVARSIILASKEVHFDPNIVDAFQRNEQQFQKIYQQFQTLAEQPKSRPPETNTAPTATPHQ